MQRFNAHDELFLRTEPLGRITEFTYDNNGNLREEKRINTPENQITTYGYDPVNRFGVSAKRHRWIVHKNLRQGRQPQN